MDEMPRVSIIILNWNGWEDTIECLESVYQIRYPNYDVIIVDNKSEDDSIQKIRAYANGEIVPESSFYSYCEENKPIDFIEYTSVDNEYNSLNTIHHEDIRKKKLILIRNERNSGFSGGNNIGIRYALENLNPDYYLLLNNDTVVHPEILSELVKGMCDERTVITGAKCYYYNYEGRTDVIWYAGGEIDFWWYPIIRHTGIRKIDQLTERGKIEECDWVTGAAMMLSKAAPIKYLDERFFFGYEDVDICMKTKSQGYRITVALNAKVWHKVGSSRKKAYPHRIKSVCNGYKDTVKLLAINNPWYLLRVPVLTLILALRIVYFLIKEVLNNHRNILGS